MGLSPVASPRPGTLGGVFTPQQAKKFFEFFQVGTHREVLLLGDLAEQLVHYVRSKGHKVLCSFGVGPCELCELAAVDKDTSVRQVEYLAPAYVRHWRDRTYEQRVAVFSAGAGEEVMRLLPTGGRNGRLDIERVAQGTSGRFKIRLMPGIPADFPSVLPPGFDLVPFVRARFGKQHTPDRPLVFLPVFKLESLPTASRPKALGLTAADCQQSEEERSKVRDLMAKWRERKSAEDAGPDPADTLAAPAPAPIAAVVAPPAEPEPVPAELRGVSVRAAESKASAAANDPQLLGEQDMFNLLAAPTYGPRILVMPGATPESDERDSADGMGRILSRELKEKHGYLNGKKPNPSANGGAK